jgi:Ca2+-binding EF-hand superfamily protein
MNKMTQKFNPALLATLFATTILSMAQVNAFERGAHRGADKGAGSFNRIDINQDGQLSLDELTTPALSKVEKKLTNKDTDEDGVISFEEFQQTRNGTMTDLSDIADEIVLCVTDIKAENGNDDIVVPSADKFMSPADKFAAIDSSGDELISLDELQATVTEKVAASFLIMDQNADGFVSEDEFNAAKAKRRATKDAVRQCIAELSSEDIV